MTRWLAQAQAALPEQGHADQRRRSINQNVSHTHMSDGIWFGSFDLDRGQQLAVAVAASSARGNVGPAWRLATHPKLAGRRHKCRDSRLPPLMDWHLPRCTRIIDGSLGSIAPSPAHIQSARPGTVKTPTRGFRQQQQPRCANGMVDRGRTKPLHPSVRTSLSSSRHDPCYLCVWPPASGLLLLPLCLAWVD